MYSSIKKNKCGRWRGGVRAGGTELYLEERKTAYNLFPHLPTGVGSASLAAVMDEKGDDE